MSKLDKDQIIARYTEAYQAVHGKAPVIEAKSGWYSVDGGKNMRLAQLAEAAEALAQSVAAKPAKQAATTKGATNKKGIVYAAWQRYLDSLSCNPKRPRGMR